MPHICVSELGNGLSSVQRQAITLTNAEILLDGSLGTNSSEIRIKYKSFHSQKCIWMCLLRNWWPFCLGGDELIWQVQSISAIPLSPCHTFPGKPWGQVTGGQFLVPAVLRRKHTPVSISHWSRPDLPASVHASPICPQTSFDHAQSFVRVTCGYLQADFITKHQHEARKVRNLLVYIPLKESRLAVDLWPSWTNACHLQSYCEFFTDKKMFFYCQLACVQSFLQTWGMVYTTMLRASFCLPADNLRPAWDPVAGDL